ncbi:transposase [Streptomyces sp. NBC_00564]|nr:transposase [Streptomyces sp. NBC_00564]
MILCETGTRGLIAAVFGPASKGETDYAHDLTGHLTPDMLLLTDRAFDSNELLADIAAQGTQFLIGATSTRRPPVLALLPDGSYLTRIGGLPLRVIEAEIHSRTADGGDFGGTYRLLTTLNDHRTDPADHLVRLDDERWEIEITYLTFRYTLLRGRVLRSKNPVANSPTSPRRWSRRSTRRRRPRCPAPRTPNAGMSPTGRDATPAHGRLRSAGARHRGLVATLRPNGRAVEPCCSAHVLSAEAPTTRTASGRGATSPGRRARRPPTRTPGTVAIGPLGARIGSHPRSAKGPCRQAPPLTRSGGLFDQASSAVAASSAVG